jgi:hypothetical protein
MGSDAIDAAIGAWAGRHSLRLCTGLGGTRFCYVSGDEHECFQVSIELPDAGTVTIHAWDVETEDDAELHQSWQVPVGDLISTLEAALNQIGVWRARPRTRHWGDPP